MNEGGGLDLAAVGSSSSGKGKKKRKKPKHKNAAMACSSSTAPVARVDEQFGDCKQGVPIKFEHKGTMIADFSVCTHQCFNCDIIFNSKKQADEHVLGKVHKKTLRQLEEKENQISVKKNELQLASAPERRAEKTSSQFGLIRKTKSKGAWHCFVCNSEVGDKNSWVQHAKSAGHGSAMQILKGSEMREKEQADAREIYGLDRQVDQRELQQSASKACQLQCDPLQFEHEGAMIMDYSVCHQCVDCDIIFDSAEQDDAHKRSSNHRNILSQLEKKKASSKKKKKMPLVVLDAKQRHMDKTSQQFGLVRKSKSKDGWHCFVCDVKVGSKNSWRCHVPSWSHTDAVSQLKKADTLKKERADCYKTIERAKQPNCTIDKVIDWSKFKEFEVDLACAEQLVEALEASNNLSVDVSLKYSLDDTDGRLSKALLPTKLARISDKCPMLTYIYVDDDSELDALLTTLAGLEDCCIKTIAFGMRMTEAGVARLLDLLELQDCGIDYCLQMRRPHFNFHVDPNGRPRSSFLEERDAVGIGKARRLDAWRCKRDVTRIKINETKMSALCWWLSPPDQYAGEQQCSLVPHDAAWLDALADAIRDNTHLRKIELQAFNRWSPYGGPVSLGPLQRNLAASCVIDVAWDPAFHEMDTSEAHLHRTCANNLVKLVAANENLEKWMLGRRIEDLWEWFDEDLLAELANAMLRNEFVSTIGFPFYPVHRYVPFDWGEGRRHCDLYSSALKGVLLTQLIERVAKDDPEVVTLYLGARHMDEAAAKSLMIALQTNTHVRAMTFNDLTSCQVDHNRGESTGYESGGKLVGFTHSDTPCYTSSGDRYDNPLRPSDAGYERPLCTRRLCEETMLQLTAATLDSPLLELGFRPSVALAKHFREDADRMLRLACLHKLIGTDQGFEVAESGSDRLIAFTFNFGAGAGLPDCLFSLVAKFLFSWYDLIYGYRVRRVGATDVVKFYETRRDGY
jgi:hypothetical protein